MTDPARDFLEAGAEAMHEVLIELSALLAGQDCSP